MQSFIKRLQWGLLIAGLTLMLGACQDSNDQDAGLPPVDVGGNPALVSVQPDSQTLTMPPTKVVATFDVAVSKLGPKFFQVGGTCSTLPAASSSIDPGGKVVTVTLSGAHCLGAQSVTLTLDPGAAEFAGPVLDPGGIWTRTYTIPLGAQSLGGTVTGLAGTLVLVNNGGDPLSLGGDGHFEFPTLVTEHAPYAVTVQTQPAAQLCSVTNGSGTMGTAAVQDVQVVCSTNTRTLGGTISGLAGGESLTLHDSAGGSLAQTVNGSFTLPQRIAQGSAYSVTVAAQPATQTCTVSNGTGIVGGTDVSNVQVVCSINAYTVGGTVSGLVGTVTLQNNGGDNLSISSDGSFTFSAPVAQGSSYNVTVLTQPLAQTCTVTNGFGTMGASNVSNVGVNCVANTTTLSVSSTGVIPVGSGTGSLTVTNTGTLYTATNVHVELPAGWTAVTQDSSNCTSIAPNNGTCTLSFSSTAPYVAKSNIPITADNVSSPPTTVLAFSVDGYLVFAVDSGSSATVVDSADISTAITWGNDGTVTNCNSEVDGAVNTACLVMAGNAPAAAACHDSTGGGVSPGTWYLPAICQLGSDGCAPGLPNLQDNLIQYGFANLASSFYWSSTESNATPGMASEAYSPSSQLRFLMAKINAFSARCVREITY